MSCKHDHNPMSGSCPDCYIDRALDRLRAGVPLTDMQQSALSVQSDLPAPVEKTVHIVMEEVCHELGNILVPLQARNSRGSVTPEVLEAALNRLWALSEQLKTALLNSK